MSNQCRSCGDAIVGVKTSTGKNMPVDAHTYEENDGLVYVPDKHISHFATCPNADKHRKPK
jgi:hypothetical protein